MILNGIHLSTEDALSMMDRHQPLSVTDDYELEADDNFRVCTCCRELMPDGYVIDDGLEYFCSDDCLHSTYTHEEYMEMYFNDDAYWTQWY